MSKVNLAALQDMAHQLRIHSIESTTAAGSGHPTSCASMAEITSALFFDVMHYDISNPRSLSNDRFVLSKGHAAPILYAAWAEAGLFPVKDLLNLRKLSSDLEGHPTPRLSFVDVATGSLGQGLAAGAGMAWSIKNLEKTDARVYVLMGDGESAEGSIWEAIAFASHFNLDNLCAIFDVNRLGQSDPTMYQHHMNVYRDRLNAFGWHAIVVDGHDMSAVIAAFEEAKNTKGKPTALVAKTFKGHALPGIEDKENWHGKALGDKSAAAIAHLRTLMTGASGLKPILPTTKIPSIPKVTEVPAKLSNPNYTKGAAVAPRLAFGEALARLGDEDNRVVVLDADTKNSTYTDKFMHKHADRFVECFIAEQNLVGVGVGLGCRGHIVFLSTFACFLARAYDQIRMAAISQSQINMVGTHVGVSIGEDGPSQMGLEDIAMFRAIPNCAVFYPSDAVSTDRAVLLAANHPGMTFIRAGRPARAVLYDNNEHFEIGKAKVLRSSDKDVVTVIGAGVTLNEALTAADKLAGEGIHIRVIDPFTIKPLDVATIRAAAKATSGKVITVEDHYPEGGIGDAVAGELADEPGFTVHKLAVRELPRSGEPDELIDHFGIGSRSIIEAVKSLLH